VTDDPPWEPPLAGTEAEHLVGALDRLRTTFRWKADDLDAAGLQVRIGASALTLGGLLKHLAFAEDYIFITKRTGEPVGEPWRSEWDGDDWDFRSAANDSPDRLYALWDGAVAWRTRPARPRLRAGRAPGQPAPARLRPDRGVRPAHRARRSAARGRRRPGRGGPSGRLDGPERVTRAGESATRRNV
jgi:hypothetical protein